MNKKKQTEQLAEDIQFNRSILPNPKEDPDHQLARLLVQDGYGKISDAAQDIVNEIRAFQEKLSSRTAQYEIMSLIFSLEKKYKLKKKTTEAK